MFTNKARLLMGALNLLAIHSPMLVTTTAQAVANDHQMDQLNQASLKSIESTWLKVPAVCKARAFNASPVALNTSAVNSDIQSIYSSFGTV